MALTITEFEHILNKSGYKPVIFEFKNLVMVFGFKRVDGLEFSLRKITQPSLTEQMASTLPKYEIHRNIEEWCKENRFWYWYDLFEDRYTFQKVREDENSSNSGTHQTDAVNAMERNYEKKYSHSQIGNYPYPKD